MHIRRLAPPDRQAVEALLGSDGTFNDDERVVALELVDSAATRPDGDYRALVAEADDGRILGYCCYGPTPMTAWTWDLYWIATHREARGQGVATRLLETMENELRVGAARIVRLETSQLEAYGAARAFYERRSYLEVGRIPDFYKEGDALLIFAKRLDVVQVAEAPAPRKRRPRVAPGALRTP